MAEFLSTAAKSFFFQGSSINGPVALAMTVHTDGHMIGQVLATLHPFRCYLHLEVRRRTRIGKRDLDITNDDGQANDQHAQDDKQYFNGLFHSRRRYAKNGKAP